MKPVVPGELYGTGVGIHVLLGQIGLTGQNAVAHIH